MKASAIFDYQASFPFSGEKAQQTLPITHLSKRVTAQLCLSKQHRGHHKEACGRQAQLQLLLPSLFSLPWHGEYKDPKVWLQRSPWRQWAGREKESVSTILSCDLRDGRVCSRCSHWAGGRSQKSAGAASAHFHTQEERQECSQQTQPQTGKARPGATAGGPAHAGFKRACRPARRPLIPWAPAHEEAALPQQW